MIFFELNKEGCKVKSDMTDILMESEDLDDFIKKCISHVHIAWFLILANVIKAIIENFEKTGECTQEQKDYIKNKFFTTAISKLELVNFDIFMEDWALPLEEKTINFEEYVENRNAILNGDEKAIEELIAYQIKEEAFYEKIKTILTKKKNSDE